MKRIVRYWKIKDFCHDFGKVVPHLKGSSQLFTEFHCTRRSHGDTENIICSEGQKECEATLIGILLLSGYVVQFANQDDLLFCTSEELEKLKEESKMAEEEYQRKKAEEDKIKELEQSKLPENPARPRELHITRDDMQIEYKAYCKCFDYPVKMNIAHSYGYLTPPHFPLGIILISN